MIFDHKYDFDQNFDFWPTFLFSTKILIFDQRFDQNFDFWPKLRFSPKILFLTNIHIFDQNLDFWPTFWFLTKILIFEIFFYFLPKFRFWQNFWIEYFLKTPKRRVLPVRWRVKFSRFVSCFWCGRWLIAKTRSSTTRWNRKEIDQTPFFYESRNLNHKLFFLNG